MSDGINVVSVNKNRTEVDIEVLNVNFHFYVKENGKLGFIKSKPEARIYDKTQLWVPDALFRLACRQAAAILSRTAKNPKIKKEPAQTQLGLF